MPICVNLPSIQPALLSESGSFACIQWLIDNEEEDSAASSSSVSRAAEWKHELEGMLMEAEMEEDERADEEEKEIWYAEIRKEQEEVYRLQKKTGKHAPRKMMSNAEWRLSFFEIHKWRRNHP